MSKTAKLFWNGRSQAVRLPKEFRMHGSEVADTQAGFSVLLEPIASDWEWLDEIAGQFSGDFLADGREQPELPRRPGLNGAFE